MAARRSIAEDDARDAEPERRWFIPTKLNAPVHDVRLVARDNLVGQLDSLLNKRLGLIVAPAGFGKTTLMVQWQARQRETGAQVAWLTLDESDGDPLEFLSYIILALTAAGVDLGALEAAAEQGMLEGALRQTTVQLLEKLAHCRRKIILILDDYHRIDAPGVDRLLTELVSAAPRNFTIVVSTRAPLKLDLPRLLATGLATEFDAGFLRLSKDELAEAFDRPLTAAERDIVFARTEGWFIAVQLARLVMREGEPIQACLTRFKGDSGHIANYLAEQVLGSLPEDLQDFLIRTSVLEALNASLADALTGRTDSLEMLRRLEPLSALLAPLSEQPGWYRYHQLFAECLQDLLQRRHGPEVAQLHLKAASWFEQQGDVAETVRHASEAGDFDRCAQLIQDAGGWELILFGGIGYLRNLLRNIPDGVLRRHPRLQIAKAYLCAKDGDLAATRALFNSARATALEAAPGSALARDLLNIGALLDIYEDRHLRSVDLEAMNGRIARLQPGDPLTTAILGCEYILGNIALGRFAEAEQRAQSAIQSMREARTVLGLNYCYLHAGIAALYQGHLQVAEAHFAVSRQMAAENFASDPGLKALSGLLYGALQHWRGRIDPDQYSEIIDNIDYVEAYDGWFELYANGIQVESCLGDSALAAVSRGRRIAAARGLGRLSALADIHLLRFARPGEEDALANRVLSALPHGVWLRDPFQWRPFVESRLALARYYAATDRVRAVQSATEASDCARHLGAVPFLIEALIVRAELLDHAGDRDGALHDLEDALTLAAPERICGPFERARGLAPLLRAIVKASRSGAVDVRLMAFSDALLSRVARTHPALAQHANAPAFSPREHEVLEDLVQGRSNKEIARSLDMTEHTVKFHLKNIFAKLKVERRAQAIARIRELGLG
ncbi:MAG: LuxR C-terminal-related transcriptional regulator [Caulobacteraceae bacterium]|nr:LuxR C-terminal-related transcriptional regulator [Caulobacteraceae bacterium]